MVVLVTGARSGFGRLTAVRAARRGHTVYAGLRDVSTDAELQAEAAGLAVHSLQLDVTDAGQREAAVAHILEREGRLDVLVNNAGIAIGGFLETLDEDEIRKMFEVNVFGAWELTRCVLPAMRAAGGGTIVNVSSVSGRIALPVLGGYAGSKFALEGMSESLRHELAPFGIRVCLVEPGPYKTDILERNRGVGRRAEEAGPYAERVAHMFGVVDERMASARPPEPVADRIIALFESDRTPRLRHPMGGDAVARIFLLRFLPFRVWETAVRWITMPRR